MEKETALTLPEETQFRTDIEAINRFQKIVHSNLIEGQDYGIIPGTGTKPTLLKPGAEKIAKLLKLADYYDIMDKQEQWDSGDKFPLFRYLIKCKLVYMPTGEVVSEGLGECNSYEAKYRWRESKRQCPVCGSEAIIKGKAEWGGGWLCFKKQGGCGEKFQDGDPKITKQQVGRTENEDIHTQINTILKMAKKRALTDAALSAGRLSNIFTQDLDDITKPEPESPPAPPKSKTPEKTKGETAKQQLYGGTSQEPALKERQDPEQDTAPPSESPATAIKEPIPLIQVGGNAEQMELKAKWNRFRELTAGWNQSNMSRYLITHQVSGTVAETFKNEMPPKTWTIDLLVTLIQGLDK